MNVDCIYVTSDSWQSHLGTGSSVSLSTLLTAWVIFGKELVTNVKKMDETLPLPGIDRVEGRQQAGFWKEENDEVLVLMP